MSKINNKDIVLAEIHWKIIKRNYLPRFFRPQLDLVTYIIINDENIKKARDALKYLSLQATSAPKLNDDEQQQSNIEEFLNHQEENAFTHNLQTKICCKKYCLTNNNNSMPTHMTKEQQAVLKRKSRYFIILNDQLYKNNKDNPNRPIQMKHIDELKSDTIGLKCSLMSNIKNGTYGIYLTAATSYILSLIYPTKNNGTCIAPILQFLLVFPVAVDDLFELSKRYCYKTHEEQLQHISELHDAYDPLQYPLLIPYGHEPESEISETESIISMDIDEEDKEMAQHAGMNQVPKVMKLNLTMNLKLYQLKKVTLKEFVVYRIQIRDSNKTTSILHLSGRLFQQYLVDQYAKWESNQQNFIYMQQLYQDSMAIVREYEKPDLFITITCNPNWHKITNELLPNQKASIIGKILAHVCVIEFQKRVLPHAILLPEDKPKTSEDFDKLVCAEIPDKNHQPLLFGNITSRNIIHRPCEYKELKTINEKLKSESKDDILTALFSFLCSDTPTVQDKMDCAKTWLQKSHENFIGKQGGTAS
ncbi:hypothetical protein RhiirA4_471357 [Rhizophagus irregularis]|uniref:Helitron helicase-like domain-containing protein n=1 Tax=Rhizophagus irregularis TaxID=588596 RepID=A0A2I1H2Z4_9GLOM|nr:hypothetical protein RhiirA4_471357 [Rhizophagus irregularis]